MESMTANRMSYLNDAGGIRGKSSLERRMLAMIIEHGKQTGKEATGLVSNSTR